MEDFILIDYLREQGLGRTMSDHELINKFKEYLGNNPVYFNNPSRDHYNQSSYTMHQSTGIKHFTEDEARMIVGNMYHYENGNRINGEYFTMKRAKELYEMYKGSLYGDVACTDLYIALNAQYHDYCPLYRQWFGNQAESKIIESAITFWFKDDDYIKGSKVMNYFK